MVDEDPGLHGTAMLTLLLRLLPSAEIFVVRVAKNTEDLAIAQERIAEVTQAQRMPSPPTDANRPFASLRGSLGMST